MALTSHELILVLRARDEASRVLRHFNDGLRSIDKETAQRAQKQFARGAALATVGVAVAAAGAYAVQALNGMTDSAIAYNQEAAKTLTQVDGLVLGLDAIKQMGIDVGTTLPVQFEEVQMALYDIFSSIEVNAPQAKQLLMDIGIAAVGGSVDMQSAGRGIIQILNAWEMGAGKASHVNDVMFQLVRKGVGTYEEFTKTIGRAVPSARKAGQSVEGLAGMMAFLTRNGLSTAMASTSAARALDAIAKPATIKRFEKMGVTITDASGKFRPMADIMADTKKALSGLSDEARAAKLEELFKGSGGTIQAMRFFNLATKDGSDLLQGLTGDMHNAGGAAKAAYDIMANTPEGKLQLMKNKYEAMKITIGDQLIPVKLKLAEALSKVFDWFLKLSPETQKWIARIAGLVAGLLIVVGVIMAVVGVFLMFAAAAAMAGVGMGVIAGVVLGVVAGIAALVAIGYLLYQNWDMIKAKGIAIWDAVVAKWNEVMAGLTNLKNNIMAFAQEVWGYLGPILTRVWNDISAGVADMMATIQPYWDKFMEVLTKVSTHAREFAVGVGNFLGNVFNFLKPVLYVVIGAFGILAGIVGGVLRAAFEMIGGIIGNLLQILTNVIDFVYNVFTGRWGEAWQNVKEIAKGAVGAIVSVFVGLGKMVGTIVYNLVKGVIDFFKHLWDVLVGNSIIPDMVNAIVKWITSMKDKFIALIKTLITNVISFFLGLPGKVISAISNLASLLYNKGKEWFNRLKAAAESGWSNLKSFLSGLPSKIVSSLGNLGRLLYNAGSNIISGLKQGIVDKFENVKDFIGGIGSWIADNKGPKAYDLALLKPAGKWIMQGLEKSLNSNMFRVARAVGRVKSTLAFGMKPGTSTIAGNAAFGRPSGFTAPGERSIIQNIDITTQEIDPLKHAADLGWELAVRI